MQPDGLAPRVRAALEDLALWPQGFDEQRALTNSIQRYLSLLVKWNRTYNLTAIRDADQMLVQHVFDCAAVVPLLKERVRRRPGPRADRPNVVDVGSGAGLPGIVLALLWSEAEVVLVEPVGKKAAFLQQVVAELALTNVTVERSRIEDLDVRRAAPDLIVCRAFASLADYAKAVDALAGPATVVAAMKAGLDEKEKRALTSGWRIAAELPVRVPLLDARRSLVVLERIEASAPG